MLRYLALATILVLACAVAAAGWLHRDVLRIRVASVDVPAAPKPQAAGTAGAARSRGLRGDAAWALSAFPECLTQIAHATGPRGFVMAHLPAGAAPIPEPATLRAGDCTIALSTAGVTVRRGSDFYRIPPPARLYRTPGGYALLQGAPASGNDLRVYEPSTRNIER